MLAFLFPGQGSLRPGMGQPWLNTPSWAVIDRLSEVIQRDVGRLLLDGDQPALQATRNAQAATFALSLVVLDYLASAGIKAGLFAGHSLGEYSALVAAGVVGEREAMQIVGVRAEAMQAAADVNPGTMAAVLGLDPGIVAEACLEANGGAWVANDNAPGQVVIAGSIDGVQAAATLARARGASRVMPLAVGGAFHSPLMEPAQAALDAALAAATFVQATGTVVTNVDAKDHRDTAWADLLSVQLCQPVRWRESLERLADLGATTFAELGPGETLTGMVKRTLTGAVRHTIGTPAQADAFVAASSCAS